MKPLIGINMDLEETPPLRATIKATYYKSVLATGGIPVLIPPMGDDSLRPLLAQLGGLILTGGPDYSPRLYGEEPSDSEDPMHEERSEFDLRLVKMAIEAFDFPILGICGGCQVLNIHFGGSLIQDIPSELPGSTVRHKASQDQNAAPHFVAIEPGTRLSKLYGPVRFETPTAHHQAIRQAGNGLSIAARADDGVIEAVELAGERFVIGVQWHPERDTKGNLPLLRTFIAQSSLRALPT